jgi:hypothetical protein
MEKKAKYPRYLCAVSPSSRIKRLRVITIANIQ